MTLSCNTNSNYTNNVKVIALESSHQVISNENNQQKIEDEELLLFLDNLKKALLEKQIDEIIHLKMKVLFMRWYMAIKFMKKIL